MKTKEEIIESFPALLIRQGHPIFMECGDGWNEIIYELCEKLEKIAVRENRDEHQASQIKEKYGSLRFYMSSETNEMSELIRDAENLSRKTCEVCGKAGSTIIDARGWMTTTCDRHAVCTNLITDF